MRKKNFKGRCEKRMIEKCGEVCKTYDAIQYAYADLLQANNGIQEIRCNVLLDGLDAGEYTSDFVCVKSDGDFMVRECVFRKFLMKAYDGETAGCFKRILAQAWCYGLGCGH